MSFKDMNLQSPIAMTCKPKQVAEKDVYKYGMTKEEYDEYINNLYS